MFLLPLVMCVFWLPHLTILQSEYQPQELTWDFFCLSSNCRIWWKLLFFFFICRHVDSTATFSTGYLSNIPLHPLNLGQAQVTCHVTCILSLSMQWFCDLCNISTEVSSQSRLNVGIPKLLSLCHNCCIVLFYYFAWNNIWSFKLHTCNLK